MERTQLHLALPHLGVEVVDINTRTLTQETTAVAEEVDQPMRVARAQVDPWLQVSLAYLRWLGLRYLASLVVPAFMGLVVVGLEAVGVVGVVLQV